mmetsp:Transcript_24060/g.80858  ORF Transcript_24060/g.80858 Transcript_24060/m.80858 type:complete len:371 (+) Transcript_24060:92-1204(+)
MARLPAVWGVVVLAVIVVVLTITRWRPYEQAVHYSQGPSLHSTFGGRGVVFVGEGCYVPVAFASATMLRQHVNLSTTLFTTAQGIAMIGALVAHFGSSPFDLVIDASSLLFRHDGQPWARRAGALGMTDTCAFRLQKILSIGRSPYEHTLFIDADAFPCSAKLADLFEMHDRLGLDMLLMQEPIRPENGYNSGYMSVKRTAAVQKLTNTWLMRVAEACATEDRVVAGKVVKDKAGHVVDQPRLFELLKSMSESGELRFATMPYEYQACRPEMWRSEEEAVQYMKAYGLPLNRSRLDHPPCPVAHINPFKNPWLITGKVDRFCNTSGLGTVSSILKRILLAGFAQNGTGVRIPDAKAQWCRDHLRRGIRGF